MSHLPFSIACACLLGFSACSTVSSGGRHPSIQTTSSPLAHALARAESLSTGELRTPEQRLTYAEAVKAVVADWQTSNGQPSRNTMTVQNGSQSYLLSASWPKDMQFDELVPATPSNKGKLGQPVLREGVGATFVAHWRGTAERRKTTPFLGEAGYVVPATVTIDFREQSGGSRSVVLRIHDPRKETTTVISGHKQPLASNLSAVGEFILVKSKEKGLGMPGLAGLRNSEKFLDKTGLMSLEPPSPDRIPVICVHGLMSRPLTWLQAFGKLGTDPEIGKNYQVYFFRYPSGVPVIYSAAKLRTQLGTLHDELARIGNHTAASHMVLIGHSMGGLVSKLQVMSTGDQLWVKVFGAKPHDLGLTKEEEDSFRQYLEFSPNPNVDRVIFICTPHRGSNMAQGFVGAVARRLVKLPGRVLGNSFDILQGEAPRSGFVKQLIETGIPTSISNLSPQSRFVKESNLLPLKPGLHVHSIIGNKSGRSLLDLKCSDGVVPYSSSHLDGVDSEFVLRSDHGAHEHPEAIAEVRRILLLHLKESY